MGQHCPLQYILKAHYNQRGALLGACLLFIPARLPPPRHLRRGHCLAHWRRGQSLRIKLHFTHFKRACFDASRRHRGVVAVWISVRDKLWLLLVERKKAAAKPLSVHRGRSRWVDGKTRHPKSVLFACDCHSHGQQWYDGTVSAVQDRFRIGVNYDSPVQTHIRLIADGQFQIN